MELVQYPLTHPNAPLVRKEIAFVPIGLDTAGVIQGVQIVPASEIIESDRRIDRRDLAGLQRKDVILADAGKRCEGLAIHGCAGLRHRRIEKVGVVQIARTAVQAHVRIQGAHG